MTEPVISLPRGRAQLVEVLAAAGDVIRIGDVETLLKLDRVSASQRLSRWTEQGWLRRVGRGAYVAASVDSLANEHVLDDPWILVPALFEPAYIGGRTAAEHWDLTEQIFNDIVVMTAQPVRSKQQERHGAHFALTHIDEQDLFGTKAVWRHRSRVLVSDVHRTIVDMLSEPSLGGGIQHVADCLNAYLKRDDRDDFKIIEYANRLENGAILKRLGFLAERSPLGGELASRSRQRLSGGYAKLDPLQSCPSTISKWRLRVPASWVPRK